MSDKPIFKSKRFWSAVVGLLMMVIVAYVPELEPLEDTVIKYVTDVVLALIAGYSLTDIIRGWLDQRQSG